MKFQKLILLTLFVSLQMFAQNIAIGQWRDHLAYNNATDVAVADKDIYCIANGNLFYFNTETNEIVRQSKPAGFSDVSATALAYEPNSKTVFIGYKSANIDLVQNGSVYNMPEIFRKQTVGNKTINNVKFHDGFAYVSTGIGIVVVDVVKREIKDTYQIDTSLITVNDIAFDSQNIYAATSAGIYKANKSNNFLADYNSWSRITSYPIKNIQSIAVFNDSLVANYNENNENHFQIYSKGNDSWSTYDASFPFLLSSFKEVGNNLAVAYEGAVFEYDASRNAVIKIYQYENKNIFAVDKDKSGNYWIADRNNSLLMWNKSNESYVFHKPAGPFDNNSSQLKASGNSIWISPGGAPGGVNSYRLCNLSIFKDNEWKVIPDYAFSGTAGAYNYWDAMCVAINPYNENKGFVGSFGRGIAEVSNDSVLKVYKADNTNNAIQYAACCEFARIGGMDYDSDGNLWIANSDAANYLVVYTNDKIWKNFQLRSFNMPQIQSLIVSKSNKIWMIIERGGLVGFDYNNTLSTEADDVEKVIAFEQGKGAIPGTSVYCVAEDLNGDLWIGSDKGISVLYNPDNIFNAGLQDVQQIKVNLDGYIGYLLESDKITSIFVDDANRKWIGTETSGLFLVSADGTQQLEHFTTDNSPILSNNIFSITMNRLSGELFIATDKGIVSYKGTATKGFETQCEDVLVYPNPVRPEYNGVIAIRGLLKTSEVRIADAAGNLVYKTNSIGGQAIWNGKNLKGDKAQSGVYYILTTNEDGTSGCSAKVVLIK